MHFKRCVVETNAMITLLSKTPILLLWRYYIQRRSIPNIRVATEQLLYLVGMIILHIYFGSFHVGVWIVDVSNLDVETLLGTLFSDRFILETFPSEHKVISWWSSPGPVVSTNHQQNPTLSQEAAPSQKNELTVHVEKLPISICIARWIVFELLFSTVCRSRLLHLVSIQ